MIEPKPLDLDAIRDVHREESYYLGPVCAFGCGSWPCLPYLLADALAERDAQIAAVAELSDKFLDLRDRGDSFGKYRDVRPHHWLTKGSAVAEHCAYLVRVALGGPS